MQSDLSSLENTGTVRSGMGRACEREKENKHACREARQEPMTHAQGPGDELGLGQCVHLGLQGAVTEMVRNAWHKLGCCTWER